MLINYRRNVLMLLSGAMFMLTGCASSHILVGEPRAPIAPEQVKLYLHAPEQFEEIALLDSTSGNSFAMGQQSKTDVAVRRLREEAAKLGANGILLQQAGYQYSNSVSVDSATISGSGDGLSVLSSGVSVASGDRSITGIAIYVPEN